MTDLTSVRHSFSRLITKYLSKFSLLSRQEIKIQVFKNIIKRWSESYICPNFCLFYSIFWSRFVNSWLPPILPKFLPFLFHFWEEVFFFPIRNLNITQPKTAENLVATTFLGGNVKNITIKLIFLNKNLLWWVNA